MSAVQYHQQTFEDVLDTQEEPKKVEAYPKRLVKKLASDSREKLRQRIEHMIKPVTELDASLLVSATYDGEKRLAVLKFYDPSTNRIFLWQDNTNHKPYAYSKESPESLREKLGRRNDIISIVETEKHEPLSDSTIKLSKIITTDPLAIGGGQNSIRDLISAWEADIKYYENYIYDKGYLVGTFYKIKNGSIIASPFETPKEVNVALEKTLMNAKPEMKKAIADWAGLLNQPLPYLKRAAIDIEVLSPENRIPNPDEAIYPVVAVSIVSKDLKRVYLLDRMESDLGQNKLPEDAEVQFYEKESDLLVDLFTDMLDFPFIATFNGDDFDLNYLYHRAQRPEVGLSKAQVPIVLGNKFAGIKYGVHIDLYKTFNNKSLQIYAFGNKYSDKTLNGIAEALLGKSKIEFDGLIGDLPIYELARYNLWDTQLTYDLISIYDDVLMKLLVAIARVGKMPIDDLSRLGVSNWIRSMLYYEHRRQNTLIPRSEELERKGGARSEAIIKGKKYKGGLVIDPVSGIHFNVAVLDFASLYPSIIKVYNISYETIDCPHPECRKNVIPEVGTWYCTKRQGIESLVVGSLRDLRVEYYKQLTKSKTLTQSEKDLYKVVSQGLKVILNACFTEDTEVITPDGSKNIKDFKVGDSVISINPQTMAPEIDNIVETQIFHYDDHLYCFRNPGKIDLKVTKNHRFLVKKGQGPISFLEAQDIEKQSNISIPRIEFPMKIKDESIVSLLDYREYDKFAISIPMIITNHHLDSQLSDLWNYVSKLGYYDKASKSFIAENLTGYELDRVRSFGGEVHLSSRDSSFPFEFKKTDFAELCGWIISAGNLKSPQEFAGGHQRGSNSTIHISQENWSEKNRQAFRAEIRQLLGKMRISFSESSHGFEIKNPALYRFCVSEIQSGSRNKRLPLSLLQSSPVVKERLISTLCKGCTMVGSGYSTQSKTLAEQVCCIVAELGYRRRMRLEGKAHHIYRVTWSRSSIGLTGSGSQKLKWITKEKFKGPVYCITTKKNHTVFAGRNGIFCPVGQSYGVLGFESFPLYCLPAAEAVATLGRYSITKTIDKCKELGIQVVYSDTDSLFLQAPSEEQIASVTSWTQKTLGIDLEVDKIYRYVAMSERKKNYFGVLSDGSVDLKGLTGKKSQTPQFIKDSFYKTLDILTKVKTKDDFDTAREEIKALLKSDYNRLKERQIPMDELAFNVMIGKDVSRYKDTIPQHVRAAQLLQKGGTEIKAGDIISFVKTISGDGAKPAKLARPGEIDVDKYLEYMKSTFDQILGSLGYDFDEILGATKLEDFFWGSR